MRLVFFGSSDFSLAPLEYCLTSGHDLLAVVTVPDKPQGRGLHVQANPVHARSEKAGVKIYAPASLKKTEAEGEVAALKPDLFVVASYGKLIPTSWLKIPQKAALNLHPSLLPRHRGAAPITWQILEGDQEVGVSIAEVTPELDAGDLFCQIRVPMEKKDTTKTLTERLSRLSVEALKKVLADAEKDALKRTPQDSSKSSYARKLEKEDGNLDLNEPAEILDRKIRAFEPWPGAFIPFSAKGGPASSGQTVPLRIIQGECDSVGFTKAKAGTLLEIHPQGYLRIQAGKGSLRLDKLQLPGRQAISGRDFANGQRLKPGFVFGSPE